MESKKAQSCLKTFLEVSKIQIDLRQNQINKILQRRDYQQDDNRSTVKVLVEERDRIQGNLDSVRLEILDMIAKDNSLISSKLLRKKEYSSVSEFISFEKTIIEDRGLFKKYPCSIEEVLNSGLSSNVVKEETIFTKKDIEKASESDVVNAVSSEKIIKTMIKTL